MIVIAEGVDSIELKQIQLNKAARNCQGYLYSKPLPV